MLINLLVVLLCSADDKELEENESLVVFDEVVSGSEGVVTAEENSDEVVSDGLLVTDDTFSVVLDVVEGNVGGWLLETRMGVTIAATTTIDVVPTVINR